MSKNQFTKKSLLVAIIADESTVTGFLLNGIGKRGKDGQSNYYIVDKQTTDNQLEEVFNSYINRDDIGVILIA